MSLRRWLLVVVVSALALSGCAGQAVDSDDEEPGRSVSALHDGADHPDLPDPVVEVDRIISGGPPPDGIPPIHEPDFSGVDAVDWLTDSEPVIVLRHEEQARIYPVQVMIWHEIVNDVLGDEPVAVTYCPLCNTAIAFRPVVEGRHLTFGTSGRLYKSALVMYDNQTESLWSQVERRAIAGRYAGAELGTLPLSMLSWADARAQLPDARVLQRPDDSDRPYGTNPYAGYDTSDWTLLDEPVDGQLPAKERVVHLMSHQVVVRSSQLARDRVANISVEGEPVVLFAAPGLASALDDRAIAEGRPIPATATFSRELGGRTLNFFPVRGRDGIAARDRETGSSWNMLGQAVAGPEAGEQLAQITAVDTFWFAAKAFQPDLTVISLASQGGKGPGR